MQHINAPINNGDQGKNVANLQDALIFLVKKEAIALAKDEYEPTIHDLEGEQNDQQFGKTTEFLVKLFQSQNSLSNKEGVVDKETADKMNEVLKSLDAFSVYVVYGSLLNADSTPAAGFTVVAYDKDIAGEDRLGEAITSADGAYRITYTEEQFRRSTGERGGADLFVRVLTEDGECLFQSKSTRNAPPELHLDVKLPSAAFVVHGTVREASENPARNVIVRAYDQDLRRQELLGQTSTNEAGYYEIKYSLENFTNAEKGNADLIVRVSEKVNEKEEKFLIESDIFFNAPSVQEINLTLPATQVEKGKSEWEITNELVLPLLRSQKQIMIAVKYEDLVPEELNTDDLDFISKETGLDQNHLHLWSLAYGRSKETGSNEESLVPPEAFYGWFRMDLPTELKDLWATTEDELINALKQAVVKNIIPDITTGLEQILNELDQILFNFQMHSPENVRVLFFKNDIGDNPILYREFAEIYFDNKGEWPAIMTAIQGSANFTAVVDRISFTNEIANWTKDNETLVNTFQNKVEIKSMHDIALNFDKAEITKLLTDESVPIPGGLTITEYTDKLYISLYTNDPKGVIINMIANPGVPLLNNDNGKTIAELLSQKQFDIRVNSVYEIINGDDFLIDFDEDQKQEVINDLKTLQRIVLISPVPEAIPALINNNYVSAYDITRLPAAQFIESMIGADLPEETLAYIYQESQNKKILNEQILINIREAIKGTGIFIIEGEKTDKEGDNETTFGESSAAEILKNSHLSWDLLFGDADFCECGECNSVYSAAAYFVELLQYLRNNNLDDTNKGTTAIKPDPTDISGTPLGKLFNRRPDIGHLELTCKNTNTLLPYVDLVNEVMEQYVAYKTTIAFNVANEKSAELLSAPQHTAVQKNPGDKTAYQFLSETTFPFTLPYHQPIDAARIFLNHMNTSRYELIETFSIKSPDPHLSGRSADAEFLGLTENEYSIITNENFAGQPVSFRIEDCYGLVSPATITDLTQVKDEFLPRTGLEYTDLIELLKTQYLNSHIQTTSKCIVLQSPNDNCSPDKVTMIHLDGTSLTTTLNGDYDKFHRFIRLWRKLGFTIDETDKAIMALGDGELSPELIHQLAVAKKIIILTGIELSKLLCFWYNIGTAGENSLYNRLFLTHNLLAIDKVFAPVNGEYFNGAGLISDHLPAVMAALNLSANDIEEIKIYKSLPDELPITIPNLSVLYRYRLLSKTLGLKIPVLIKFLDVVGDVFENAGTTLHFLEVLNKTEEAGFTAEQLSYIIKGIYNETQPYTPTKIEVIVFAKKIYDGLNSIETEHPDLVPEDLQESTENQQASIESQATAELIRSKASILFDTAIVEQIMSILEAPDIFKTSVPKNLDIDWPSPNILENKLSYDASSGELTVKGILDPTETAAYTNLQSKSIPAIPLGADWNKGLTDTIKLQHDQVNKMTDLFHSVMSGIFGTDKTVKDTFCNLGVSPPKRAAFITGFLGYLRVELKERLILDELSNATGLEKSLVQVLSVDILKFRGHSLYDNLASGKELPDSKTIPHPTPSSPPASIHSWYGKFIPTTDGDYTFIVRNNNNLSFNVVIDSAEIILSPVKTTPSFEWWSAELKLEAGRVYQLSVTGVEMGSLYWKTKTSAIEQIPGIVLLPSFKKKETRVALEKLKKMALLINGFSLSVDEIKYLQGNTDFDSLDFDDLELKHFLRIADYCSLRNSLPQTNTNILNFWNSLNDQAMNLSDEIARLTLWKRSDIEKLISSTHLDKVDFKNEQTLLRLQKALAVVGRTGMDIAKLFEWAAPGGDFGTYKKHADEIQKAIRAQYNQTDWEQVVKPMNDRLRNNQKDALIAYLLQQPELKKAGVYNADGLFEYFLIDVQMDTCMETSRIKQAISSVQLFVQRCFLGLEKKDESDLANAVIKGVDPTILDRNRWEWMQSYRVWEANRKVFLYPENWIESNLRDDKSPFFKELESELLQKDISKQNVTDALKTYLYKVDEVANMEVVGLYIEGKLVDDFTWDKGAKLHVFSRTNNAPYFFYYRYLALDEKSWYPWEKMQVDVPSYDIEDIDGKITGNGCYLTPVAWNGRLLIFFPQFMKKTKAAENDNVINTTPTNGKITMTNPIEYWEIKMAWSEYRNGKWTQKQLSKEPQNHYKEDVSIAPIEETQLKKKSDDLREKMNKAKAELENMDPPEKNEHGAITPSARNIYNTRKTRLTNTYLQSKTSYENALAEWQKAKSVNENIATTQKSIGIIYKYEFVPVLSIDNNCLEIKVFYDKNNTEIGSFEFNGNSLQPHHNSYPQINSSRITSFFHYVGTTPENSSISSLQLNSPPGYFFQRFLQDVYFVNLNFFHSFIHNLNSKINESDLSIFFKQNQELSIDKADAFGSYDGDRNKDTPDIYHELKRPYSLYNWELFFHTPIMLADTLSKAQQFEEAMKWFHYVFNPIIEGTEDNRFWQFAPFKEINSKNILEQIIKNLEANKSNEAISAWRNNPFNPHLVARDRPVAYMKWVVMKYIDNILDWGDYLFRQETIESINKATQLYVLAGHILGRRPMMIPKRGEFTPQTYHSLLGKWDAFSNAMSEFEVATIYSIQPAMNTGKNGGKNPEETPTTDLFGTISALYFCIPDNPKLLCYWDTLADRLFKIRHCQNIEGVFRQLSLFEPPIDPALLVKAAAQGLSIPSVVNDLNGSMPNYRFYYLLQKALELCNELKSLGCAMLSAIEKKDNEAISLIRAKHEGTMNNLLMEIKKLQLEEAQKSLESLQQNRKAPEARMNYFLKLVGESEDKIPASDREFNEIANAIEEPIPIDGGGLRLIRYEKEEFDKLHAAKDWQLAIGAIETLAGILHAFPNIATVVEPLGVGVGFTWGPQFIGNAAEATARGLQMGANFLSYEATNAAKRGGYQRALQERIQQANAAGYELKQIDKQITAQLIRIDITNKEINNQQKQIDNANEVEEFLKNKYTNEELYTWMRGSLKALYRQVYNLAYDLAKKAEKTYCFERGVSNASFIQSGYFDAGREGLLSGEKLYVGLKQLEAAYQEKRGYDYEITKHISLRQLDPLALLQLKAANSCEFSLPEVMFDMDFPGHYKRRIKSVSISIPNIAGPYTGVNATLKLLQNKFRNSAIAKSSTDYSQETDSTPPDRFITYNIPITSIATSSAQNDSGTFELNFKEERYLPFEGAGVISKWRLELPAIKQFDYNTISDVLLHVKYIASEGGDNLKLSAKESVDDFINATIDLGEGEGLFTLIDLMHDMPNEWNILIKQGTAKINIDVSRLSYMAQLNSRIENITFVAAIKEQSSTSQIHINIIQHPDEENSSDPPVDLTLIKQNAEVNLFIGTPDKSKVPFNLDSPFGLTFDPKTTQTPEDLILIVKYSLMKEQ